MGCTAMSQGMKRASRNLKRHGNGASPFAYRKNQPANTSILVSEHSFWTSNLQNCKRINLCCFKLQNLW